jgi:hypothetical protein
MKDLASQNIPISEREISYLGKKLLLIFLWPTEKVVNRYVI